MSQSLGAREPKLAERYGIKANQLALIFMAGMGFVFFFWPHTLARLFTREPRALELSVACIQIVAFAQPFFSVLMTLSRALRGVGDTRWVMYITAAGDWGVRLVLFYLIGLYLGLELPGLWLAMLIDACFRSGLTYWRYRSGKWKEIIKVTPGGNGPRKNRDQTKIKPTPTFSGPAKKPP